MDKRSPLFLPVFIVIILVWLSFWLVLRRHAFLDDTLIHLHYADMLHRHHFITFDGIHHGFGTSSLLYVSLLAFLRGFFASPLLPKVVSDTAYLILIGVVLALFVKFRENRLSQLLLAELCICLLSPMGIRWLTDGMETSLTILSVVLLAIITGKEQEDRPRSGGRFLLLAVFGAALVFLRIELALLVALSCLSILVVKASKQQGLVRAALEASPLAIGAVLAMVAVRILMGSLLPDTALAKSSHRISIEPLILTLQVLASSLILGVGAALCWAQSLLLAARRIIRSGRQVQTQLFCLALENCAIFIVVGLSCLRGQAIQGVRYVIWPFVFGIVANASRLASDRAEQVPVPRLDMTEKGLVTAFVVLCLIVLPLDWRLASHAMLGRSATFS